MTFVNLLTNQVVVARLVAVTGKPNNKIYSTITAEYNVSIHRLDSRRSIDVGGAVGKTFRLYAENSADIQKGDKLRDESGNDYQVYSVNIPATLGNFVHKEIIILRVNPYD
jgi:hypothetical protein